jgi:Zn-dependent metalloprotease
VFFVLTKTKWSLTGLLLIASSLSWSIERESARGIDLNSSSVNQGRTFSAGSQLHQKFGLSSGNTLIQKSERIDQAGKTHKRYQQYYKGVPIWGDTLTVHSNPAGKLKASGFLIKGLERTNISDAVDNGPSITADQAITSVQAQLKHSSADWVISAESIKAIIYIENQKVTLAYLIEYLAEPANTQIPFRSSNALKPSRPFFILDANTGKTLKKWEGLNHVKIGTGPGGNEKIGRYEYGNDFAFLDVQENADTCTLENDNVKTVNLNNGTSGSTAYSYTCPENTFQTINGAYSPLNDAHYFGNVVFNMYQDWLNTSPLSFQLIMRVHYDTNYDNAFWDGQAMSFGDGASMFYPLVDINVSAHEVSHGFTEQNSGLVYSNESGGMNEAFSDIAGEAAEFYLRGHVDWLVGADITKNMTALRYFENPTLDGISIGHTDDYSNGMDVHNSSGIYNRAFYLLANSANWDVQTAFITFAHANMNYWTANETFINGACGVIDSAYDLNYDFLKVDTAFKAVGIDCGTLPFYDMDGDGMDDKWEIANGLDNTDPSDASLDNDSDLLSNLQEYTYRTNPLLSDSDGDSLSDYDEVMTHNTNPNASDSDNDGLTDDYEINTSSTNPLNSDTDGDNMPDGWETTHSLDPLSDDALLDKDGDGTTNIDEFTYGTDPTDAESRPTVVAFNFESNEPPEAWTTPDGSDASWQIDTANASKGTSSLRAQAITHSQNAQIEFSDYFIANSFSFFAKTSSEQSYDFLYVYVDNVRVIALSGNNDWQKHQLYFNDGPHTIRFEYHKDVIVDSGQDTVWIDDIIYLRQVTDIDSDGMPDYWEARYSLNINDPSDATLDNDNDYLSNLEEFIAGTNPLLSDTDNDGLADNVELEYELDPTNDDANLDMDNDGLSNINEIALGTQLNNPDSDSDGIPDGLEVESGINPLYNDANLDLDNDGLSNIEELDHGTKINNRDSDSDGMSDGWEVNSELNPLSNDANLDLDRDGLKNIEELNLNTQANNSDSDTDGMPDGWEVSNRLNPLNPDDSQLDPDDDGLNNLAEYRLGTNINSSDTDFDGVTDSREINEINTNPLVSDSDSDGVNDAEDYYPNDPNRADKEDESNSLGGGPINPYLLLSLLLIICSRFRKS